MDRLTLAWTAFGLYLAVTAWLAWLGHKKTDSLESFAVGRRDMGPWLVGITMAASLASTATFIINPGFVFVHGLAAFMHFGVAVGLGVAVALFTLSPTFRRVGVQGHALSLPHWIGVRFGSTGLRVLFGLVNMLSIAFVVLIVGGVQLMLQRTLDLSATWALVVTIGFVFSYILVGGTYAHTYTNTLQGILMVIVALVIVVDSVGVLIEPGFLSGLAERAPHLLSWTNPRSTLFSSAFSVYVAGFVIGFAVVCQPHLLMKALYLKEDRDVRRYVQVTLGVTAIFFALMLAGLAAHSAFAPGQVPQDHVMAVWLASRFGDVPFVLISVALVAAGMSTLDGILVAMSTIASNDIFLPIAERTFLKGRARDVQARAAFRFGQASLVALGLGAFFICLGQPPKYLGIFGQVGVYGILAAAVAPVVLGVVRRDAATLGGVAKLAAVAGAGTHFALYFGHFDPNPAVTATWGIFAAAGATVAGLAWSRRGSAVIEPVVERG